MKTISIKKILLFCFTLSVFLSYSTPIPDSLVFFIQNEEDKEELQKSISDAFSSDDTHKKAELYNRIAVHLSKKQEHSKAISYFQYAAELYKEINSVKEEAVCLSYIANAYYNISRYEKCISTYNTAIDLYNEINLPLEAAKTYDDIGFVYFNTHRYKLSKAAYLSALKIKNENLDTLGCAGTCYYIGNMHFEQDEKDSAFVYFIKSLQYDRLLANDEEIIASYNNIALILYQQGFLNKAKAYLDSAATLIENTKDPVAKAINFNNIGNILFEYGNTNDAISLYKKSLAIKESLPQKTEIAISLHNMGNCHKRNKEYETALPFYEKSLSIAKEKEDIKTMAANYKSLSELYKAQGDHKQAYEYYKSYILIQSSLYGEENRQLSEMLNKYSEKRNLASNLERELHMQEMFASYDAALKDKKITKLKAKHRFQKYINYGYIGILIFILLASFFIINRSLIKKKSNINLAKKNTEIEEKNTLISKQALELEESNRELEKLSIVASDTANAVIIMDADGNFEWVNDAYTRIFGFTYEELVSTISPNMIGESTPEYIIDKFNYCKKNKATVDYEFNTRTKEGKGLWINVTLTPILNKNGEISRLISIDSDITSIKDAEAEILMQKEEIETQRDELQDQKDLIIEQKEELEKQKEELSKTLNELKRTQTKLVESEKMAAMGNLVAGISHEINTPVGIGIAASSSMVTRTINLQELFTTKKMKMSDLKTFLESTTQACELILTNLNRTAELVKSFKQVSVDNMTEQKRSFNLNEYLHDIIRSLGPKLKHRPVEIEVDCDASINLNSYPGAFAQIYTNFVINSLIHAYDETQEGTIKIIAKEDDSTLTIIYKDNGKGIPEENMKKIFDPFFTTNMQVGTGLGMNITYNLVTQKLKGEIDLKSETGKGVEFTITIPKSELA